MFCAGMDSYWYSGSTATNQAWQGTGTGFAVNGAYTNWGSGQPNDTGGAEDFAFLQLADGLWNDHNSASVQSSVVQWNADDVLDATNALTYSITSQTVAGAFTINSDSGVITVANGSLLNFESQTSQTLTVRVTDGSGATFDKAFTVAINNLTENTSTPTDLSTGINLNTDGGNNAYLISSSAGSVFGGRTAMTIEVNYTMTANGSTEQPLISYAVGAQDNEVLLRVSSSGAINLTLNQTGTISSGNIAQLLDGKQHSIAVSWDNTNGDVVFYVDGQRVAAGTYAAGATLDAGGTLVVGQDQDSVNGGYDTAQRFSGTLHEIRVWDRAISGEQISQNYQQKLTDTPTGLVANWRMTGLVSGTTVVDAVGGVNLTVANVTGGGWTTSTPTATLTIAENSANGTTVGSVVVSEANNTQDVVADGLFREAANPGSLATYGAGQSIGNWTVQSGDVDYIGTYWQSTPMGGRSIDLNGGGPGAISQTLSTTAGRQYQVIFNLSGNWTGGEATKDLRVSAAGISQDFSTTQPSGWSTSNMLFSSRSMTFTATGASTSLAFQSLDSGNAGAAIGDVRVIEIPAAVTTILNNDSTLSYDAATGKFYRFVSTITQPLSAISAATSATLNGVNGQLATIRSAYENELIRAFAQQVGGDVLLGGRDATTEGTWRFLNGATESEQFSTGSTAQTGYYTNWRGGEPNGSTSENQLAIRPDGEWQDVPDNQTRAYAIEWDASEVLSNFTYSLTSNPGSAFAINSNTGEITVATSSQLDYETGTSRSITVQVTDGAGNTYSEAFTINLVAINDNTPVITSNGGGSTGLIGILENQTTVTTVVATDADQPVQTLTYSIIGGPDSALFSIHATTGVLAFIAAPDFEAPTDSNGDNVYSVIVQASDGSLADMQTISVTISNRNDAPVLDASGTMALNTITEDDTTNPGQTVASIISSAGGDRITDQDAGALEGMGVTGWSGSNGTWQYSVNSGSSWSNVGTVSDSSVLMLRGTDLVRFVPNGQNGTTGSLTFRAWDQSTGTAGFKMVGATFGGNSAFSAASETASLSVTSVNDAPTITNAYTHTLTTTNENTTSSGTLASAILTGSTLADVDSSPSSGLAITSVTGNGTWQYSTDGTTWTNFGAVSSTNALLISSTSQVRYIPDNNNGETAAFGYKAWDQTSGTASVNGTPAYATTASSGGTTAFSSNNASAQIVVSSVNDAPVLDNAGNMTLTTITEDQTSNSGNTVASIILSAGGDRITDVDSGAVEGIAISATSNGNAGWQFSIDGGTTWRGVGAVSSTSALLLRSSDLVRFVPNGLSGTTADLTFRAWDQSSGAAGSYADTSTNGGTSAFSTATETASITAPGVNDAPTFHVGDGILTTAVGTSSDSAQAVAVQADGKLVVVGTTQIGASEQVAIVRYNADGSLDTSFGGGDGIVTTAVGTSASGRGVVLQSDGRIVVSAWAYTGSQNEFAVLRYNTDGTLDSSFGGGDGIATAAPTAFDSYVERLTLQADGKIVLVGASHNGSNFDFAITRFNTNGTLDNSFSSDGIVTTAIGSGLDVAYDVVVQADGRLVVGGYSINGNGDIALVRYNSDGSLDTSFDGDGIRTFSASAGADSIKALALQSDGRIVAAGTSLDGTTVVRFNTDGSLDTSFNGTGKAAITVASGTNDVFGVAVQTDGRIVLAGSASNGTNLDFSLVRFNSNGTADTSFSGDGRETYSIGTSTDAAYGLALQSDGSIVAVGSSFNGVNNDFAVIRILANGTPDPRFDLAATLGGAVSFTEGGAAAVLDANAQIFDAELTAANNFSGATLTLVRNGGASSEDAFSATGTLSVLTQGGNLVVGGTTVGTVTTNGSGTLVLTFTVNATNALVNSVMQQIAYSNSSDVPPASAQIDWTFNDGNTGSQGTGGMLTSTGSVVVNITAINDAPNDTGVIGSTELIGNGSFESGTTGWTITGSATPFSGQGATDGVNSLGFNAGNGPNDGVATTSLTTILGQAYTVTFDMGAFGTGPGLNATQSLNVQVQGASVLVDETLSDTGTDPSTFGSYRFTFIADSTTTTLRFADASSLTTAVDLMLDNIQAYAVTTTSPSMSIAENSSNGTTVGQVASVDPDAYEVLSYSLTNDAGGRFAINSSTGQITVANSSLLNAEANNFHSIVVRTTDLAGATFDKTMTVNVTNVNEAPTDLVVRETLPLTLIEEEFDAPLNPAIWQVQQGYDAGSNVEIIGGQAKFTGRGYLNTVDEYDPADGGVKVTGRWTIGTGYDTFVVATRSNATPGGTYGDVTSGIQFDLRADHDFAAIRGIGGVTLDTYGGNQNIVLSDGDTFDFVVIDDGLNLTFTVTKVGDPTVTATVTATSSTQTADNHVVIYNRENPIRVSYLENLTIQRTEAQVWNGVAEDATNGTVVAHIDVADPDAGDIHTFQLTDDANGRFAIDPNTGEITVADATQLDHEANTSHTVTVRVTDAASQTYDETFTILVSGANENPIAVSDTATAVEAGGTANGTAGTNPSGNVLTNDTDVDAGDTKTVTGVVAGTSASASGSVGAGVAGAYGSINIAADGTYSYTVDNNNAAVHALRTTSNTLTDVYTYTMRDAAGLTSTTQITVTIQGANDAPSDLAIANPSGTNLISNGSFETNNGAANTFTFGPSVTVSGWTAIGGEGFEVWNNYNGDGPATASLGISRLELNVSSAINGISQNVNTSSGQTYVLSFDLASRTGLPNSETQVYWRGELVGTIAQTEVAWRTHSFVVTGSGGSDELRFLETTTNNASGSSLLDNVRLIAENSPTVAVAENAANGTVVALAGARDADTVSIDTRTYSLTDTAGGRFAVDATTGVITVAD